MEGLIVLALGMGGFGSADPLHMPGPIAVMAAEPLVGNHGRQWAMSETTHESLDTFQPLPDEMFMPSCLS
jgi:CPA1 family monovalent cation:H+ antiporter